MIVNASQESVSIVDETSKRTTQLIYSFINRFSIKLMFVFFVSMALTCWRFWPWEPKVFFADDLFNLWLFYDGSFFSTILQSLTASFYERYRPVFQLLFHFVYSIFDKTLGYYLALNIVLQGLNSLLFFLIATKLSRNKFFIPLILTCAFAASRLALYQVTQTIGPVESVALVFFLTMIYATLTSLDAPKPKRWHWLAIFAATFCIYTHERYIVIIPWLACILLTSSTKKEMSFKYRCSLMLACALILSSNFLIKTLIFHSYFFAGPGGSHITVDSATIFTHIHEAFLSLFGFNEGPAYLIGNQISTNPNTVGNDFFAWLMATTFSLSFICVILSSIFNSRSLVKANLTFIFGAISLICLLLTPPIMSFRLEGRWEYVSFSIVLLMFAWAYGLPMKRISNIIIGIVCIIASLSIFYTDTIISNSFDRIYMVGWAKFGNAIKTDMIPAFSKQHSNELLLFADKDACGTVIINRLFELHTGRKPIIHCAETKDDLAKLTLEHPGVLSFEYNNLKFTPTS